MKKVLTIAGSDSGGGAGIQADIKTFSALGVYGMSVVTAITAQNTMGVLSVQDVGPEMVKKQLEAVFSDIGADAVKIGMLFSGENIETVADMLQCYQVRNIVLDPVLYSTSGSTLLQEDATRILFEKLLPIVDVITPNLSEAEKITGITVINTEEMKKAAVLLHKMGPKMVLVKGGHLQEKPIDIFYDGTDFFVLEAERINTVNTHGTGCTLASAIAAYLARGLEPLPAVRRAKEYVTESIRHSFNIGHGNGPVHHFYKIRE